MERWGRTAVTELTQYLAQLIASDHFKHGQPFLSERELARRFKVSRGVIRQVKSSLRERGLLRAGPQRAWVVIPGRVQRSELSRVLQTNGPERKRVVGATLTRLMLSCGWNGPERTVRESTLLSPGRCPQPLASLHSTGSL
jgi:DNA-binding FadR family transcriptional regulator